MSGVQSVESWDTYGRTVVHQGDVTLLYSDGVTEATRRSGDEFGVGRLSAIVAAEGAAISTACRRGLADVGAFHHSHSSTPGLR